MIPLAGRGRLKVGSATFLYQVLKYMSVTARKKRTGEGKS